MENVSALNALLDAAKMAAKPTYSAANDLPAILNLPRRKVMALIRAGRIPVLEVSRKNRVVTHAGLAAAVQGFIRATAANDEHCS